MSQIDDMIDEYEVAASVSQTDFSHLGVDDFASVEFDSDGAPHGMVMGVPVAINQPAPAPQIEAPTTPIEAGVPAEAEEAPDQSIFRKIGDVGFALDSTFSGLTSGVVKFVANTASGLGLVDQDKVDQFTKMMGEASNVATEGRPGAKISSGVGSLAGQYVLPAVTGFKALRAVGASPVLASVVADSLTGYFGISPNDENIFNMISEDTTSPAAAAVRNLLATDPDSPDWQNRVANAGEALAFLGGSEVLIRGLPEAVRKSRELLRTDQGQKISDLVGQITAAGGSAVRGVDQALDRGVDMMGGGNTLGMGVGPVPKAAEAATDIAAASYPNTMNRMLYDSVEAPPAPEGTRKWTKATLARAMQEEAEANGQAITKYDDAARDTLGSRIAEEAAAALKREGNASDWYNSKILEMNNNLRQIHPEIEDGSTAEGIFKAGLSLTSNGSTVDYNLRAAEHVYSVFKETGRYPTDLASLEKAVGGFGQEGPTLIKQFERANTHIDEMGADGFVEFLNTKFTVKELNAMGYKVTGEAVDFETYGSAIFGPKIGGGFYQNLRGNFEPVTFDRWWMASWGRWTGQPLKKNTAAARAKQLDRFRVATGKQYKDPNAAIAAAKKIYAAYRKNNFQPRTELNQSAQRLAEGATDAMKEQPAGPTERAFMRKVTYDAVEKLRQMGYDVTPADLQATVWYPEKELHGFYGIGSGRSAPDDYAAAAQRLLEERNAGR